VIASIKQSYWADRLRTFADEDNNIIGLWEIRRCWRVQGNQKVAQPIPDTCSICQKINYTEIKKQKQCYIKC
jgi:hypothetical protein